MPAVLLWVLVGFQLATPVVLPGRVVTRPMDSDNLVRSWNHHAAYGVWFGRDVTWGEIERAANGSAAEVEMMKPFISQIRGEDAYGTWVGIDPAARISLADGEVGRDDNPVDAQSRHMFSLGLIDPWLHCDVHEHNFRMPTTWTWYFAYLPVPNRATGNLQLFYSLSDLSFTLVQTAIGVFLIRIFAVRRRRIPPRAWFKSVWVWLTLAITVALAAAPPRFGPYTWPSSASSVPRYSFNAIQLTDITIERLRSLANEPDAASRIARALFDARMRHTKGGPTRLYGPNTGESVASIAAERQTAASDTSVNFGWPSGFLDLKVRDRDAPVGAEATQGWFRLDFVNRRGFRFQTNHGAWPGRSIMVHLSFAVLAESLVISLAAWWLLRAVLRSRLLFRGRKRAARGLCVGCGYDLKGLRRRAVVSE